MHSSRCGLASELTRSEGGTDDSAARRAALDVAVGRDDEQSAQQRPDDSSVLRREWKRGDSFRNRRRDRMQDRGPGELLLREQKVHERHPNAAISLSRDHSLHALFVLSGHLVGRLRDLRAAHRRFPLPPQGAQQSLEGPRAAGAVRGAAGPHSVELRSHGEAMEGFLPRGRSGGEEG